MRWSSKCSKAHYTVKQNIATEIRRRENEGFSSFSLKETGFLLLVLAWKKFSQSVSVRRHTVTGCTDVSPLECQLLPPMAIPESRGKKTASLRQLQGRDLFWNWESMAGLSEAHEQHGMHMHLLFEPMKFLHQLDRVIKTL